MSEGEILVTRERQGGPAASLARLWRVPMAWWRDAPIADPVDRRNAPMLVSSPGRHGISTAKAR